MVLMVLSSVDGPCAAMGKLALSDQRGSRTGCLLTGQDEPQIPSQTAKPVPVLQLLARGDRLGSAHVRPFPAVAA